MWVDPSDQRRPDKDCERACPWSPLPRWPSPPLCLKDPTDCERGLGVAVLSTDALGHHAVQRTGHERQLHVEIHFHADHGGERVYMEELDGMKVDFDMQLTLMAS